MGAIRYFARKAEEVVGLLFAISLACGLFFTLFGALEMRNNTIEYYIRTSFWYLIMMGAVMIFSMHLGNEQLNIPLSLSLGSRRKEVFWGIQNMNLLVILQVTIFLVIIQIVFPFLTQEIPFSINGLLLFGFLFLAGMGQICSAVSIRFGGKGNILFIAIIVVVVVNFVLGILQGVSVEENVFGFGVKVIWDARGLNFLMIAGSVLLYALSMWIFWKVLKRYEVRN